MCWACVLVLGPLSQTLNLQRPNHWTWETLETQNYQSWQNQQNFRYSCFARLLIHYRKDQPHQPRYCSWGAQGEAEAFQASLLLDLPVEEASLVAVASLEAQLN